MEKRRNFWRNWKVTSKGNKRHDKVSATGGNEMRQSGGEDMGPVSHRAIALVDEFKLLITRKPALICENPNF